ncbi:MAG: DUF4160 domain-containing protein [Gemmatimonadota bacterium]
MSPTILRVGSYRFFFFSREEARAHVHVDTPDGEAKFWIEPEVALARNHKLPDRDVATIEELIRKHEREIRDAWNRHFGS